MGIPELPTDNLYKFMATFGFLVATLSFGYLVVNTSNHSEAIAKLEVQEEAFAAISNAQRAYYERRAKALSENSESARSDVEQLLERSEFGASQVSSDTTDDLVVQSEKLSSELNAFLLEYEDFIVKFEERALPLTQDLAAIGAKVDDWRWISAALILAGSAGGIVSAWGFILWYRNVQIYQDAILRTQAKKPSVTEA